MNDENMDVHAKRQEYEIEFLVDIFRKSEEIPPIVEQIIKMREAVGRPFVIWMQVGIVNEEAAKAARQAGLVVVMDKCLMVEHLHSKS